MNNSRVKFVLYTNPNNVTNFAYKAVGAMEANDVLRNAKAFPDSYRILHQGRGNEQDINTACTRFGYYKFV